MLEKWGVGGGEIDKLALILVLEVLSKIQDLFEEKYKISLKKNRRFV